VLRRALGPSRDHKGADARPRRKCRDSGETARLPAMREAGLRAESFVPRVWLTHPASQESSVANCDLLILLVVQSARKLLIALKARRPTPQVQVPQPDNIFHQQPPCLERHVGQRCEADPHSWPL
jgi:hypothetical protein